MLTARVSRRRVKSPSVLQPCIAYGPGSLPCCSWPLALEEEQGRERGRGGGSAVPRARLLGSGLCSSDGDVVSGVAVAVAGRVGMRAGVSDELTGLWWAVGSVAVGRLSARITGYSRC